MPMKIVGRLDCPHFKNFYTLLFYKPLLVELYVAFSSAVVGLDHLATLADSGGRYGVAAPTATVLGCAFT